MRKLLLLGTALAAVSLAMPAFAQSSWNDGDGSNGDGNNYSKPTFEVSLAAALAGNSGHVAGNGAAIESQSTSANISGGSYNGSKGVSNTNQNAGANSVLQNALAVSYIQGCNCSTTYTVATGAALAAAGNRGEVENNSSSSRREVVGHYYSQRFFTDGNRDQDDYRLVPIYGPDNYVTANIDSSFNGVTGVFQVNQNSGDNSLLQNSAAVAAVNPVSGTALTLAGSLADADNKGAVAGNYAREHSANASSTITKSFDRVNGVVNVNQNSGANSLMQNSAAIGTVKLVAASSDALAGAVANANTNGGVYCNTANLANGSAKVSMDSSFNGAQGVLQASQNTGANSLIQNSVSVAAVR